MGGRGEVIETLVLPGFGTPSEGDIEVLVEDAPDCGRKWRYALLSVGVIHLLELPSPHKPRVLRLGSDRDRGVEGDQGGHSKW